MICSRKGYPLKVVMPDNVTPERTQLLEMYGAQIVSSEGSKGSNGAVEMALEMAHGDSSYYMPYQYGNPANPLAHYNGTALEILEELDDISAFVAGLGTGGTLMGNGRRLKETFGDAIRIVAAEPMQGEPVQGLLARRRLHPADHRSVAAGPQDLRHQPRRDRVDAQAARRGGHLRRRLQRGDRPCGGAHRRRARRGQRRVHRLRRRLEVPLQWHLHPPGGRDRQPGFHRLVVSTAMVIDAALLQEVVAHAREDAPNECCGMIASRDGEAQRVYRATNTAASPLRYEIDGLEQYRIQNEIEDAGLDLGAIYHSHTRSAPYPSQTDINLAFYPDSLYIIVGLAGDEPDVRAYRIADADVQEVGLEVR